MYKYRVVSLFLLFVLTATAPVLAKHRESRDENGVQYKISMLMNGADVSKPNGTKIMYAPATIQHGLYWCYTRVTRKSMILSFGAGFTNGSYKLKMYDDKQKDYGYTSAMDISTKVTALDVDLAIGYRFESDGKVTPEIRFGNIVRTNFYETGDYASKGYLMPEGAGPTGKSYVMDGTLGRTKFLGNLQMMIQYFYAGLLIKTSEISRTRVKLGLQFQRKFFRTGNMYSANYHFYDASRPNLLVEERYRGSQTGLGLVVGITF